MERNMLKEISRIQGIHGSYGSLVNVDMDKMDNPVQIASQLIAQMIRDTEKVIVFTLQSMDTSDLWNSLDGGHDSKAIFDSLIVNDEMFPYYEKVIRENGDAYNNVLIFVSDSCQYGNNEEREKHLNRLNRLVMRFHRKVVVINNPVSESHSRTISDCTIEYYSHVSPDRIHDLHSKLYEHMLWGEYDQSIDLANLLAMNDDPKGLYIFAMHERYGWSYPIDLYSAADDFRNSLRLAGKDFVEPLVELYKLYKDPDFVEHSEELSVLYLQRAAILGHRNSMQMLAEWYADRNYIEEAVYWYQQIGERFSDGAALFRAADLLIDSEYDTSLAWGVLIPRASEMGNRDAIRTFASALAGKKDTGGCVAVDPLKAVSVMQSLMDAPEHDSPADVIDDAISCIEILQTKSDD